MILRYEPNLAQPFLKSAFHHTGTADKPCRPLRENRMQPLVGLHHVKDRLVCFGAGGISL